MFGALESISDKKFYMCMQNVQAWKNVREGLLIHTLEVMAL